MAILLLIAMASLGLAGIIAWAMAMRLSYIVERQRDPGLPQQRLALTNLFRSAFFSPPGDRADPALRRKLRARIYAALACILAMGVLSFALPLLAVEKPAAAEAALPPPDPTGTTLSYIRSNQDGSKPERIVVHVVSPTEVHVAKMTAPCTDAAYVTATFNADTGEAMRLVGGRLNREGGQNPQVWLDVDHLTRKMDVRFGDPASKPAETHDAPPAPWRMYDFDLAEFAVLGPRAPKDFNFGLAMAWPDGTSPSLRILGPATATFLYSSDGGARNHFRIGGPAFTDPLVGDKGGEIVTDAVTGHVVEARLGRPNHTDYANLMLKLTETAPGPEGEAAWKKALTDHWANCPA